MNLFKLLESFLTSLIWQNSLFSTIQSVSGSTYFHILFRLLIVYSCSILKLSACTLTLDMLHLKKLHYITDIFLIFCICETVQQICWHASKENRDENVLSTLCKYIKLQRMVLLVVLLYYTTNLTISSVYIHRNAIR